jgi:hypothetical protein
MNNQYLTKPDCKATYNTSLVWGILTLIVTVLLTMAIADVVIDTSERRINEYSREAGKNM